jgi:hypothetical protein
MTQGQKETVEFAYEQAMKEALYCYGQIVACYRNSLPLPQTNEQGIPVTDGCNLAVFNVANYWTTRLNALESLLSRAQFVKLLGFNSTSDIVAYARKLGKNIPKEETHQ